MGRISSILHRLSLRCSVFRFQMIWMVGFSPEFLPNRWSWNVIASYEPPHENDGIHRNVSEEETDPWATRQALEQLAALGYIDLPEADKPQDAIDNTRPIG